ncbi:hypothetical protein Afil01_22260 [Actinorhabdospora filicis]|uniref:Uncharacterized protein n=1 Tax=Actinorhabdospora filicis TaxID=1785913 RepID=A0A9W6W8B4_9ACTN|nr:hypothetical protein [Actinorhabdospora filicis]GLZ77419.1 hypothetical protein Afil01_22260 [Actinorhabdospora filicis]
MTHSFPTVPPPFPGPARRRPTHLPLTALTGVALLAGGLVAAAAFWWPPLGSAAGVVAAVFFGLSAARK